MKYSQCNESRGWREILDQSKHATGGLGDLMVIDQYEVWLCLWCSPSPNSVFFVMCSSMHLLRKNAIAPYIGTFDVAGTTPAHQARMPSALSSMKSRKPWSDLYTDCMHLRGCHASAASPFARPVMGVGLDNACLPRYLMFSLPYGNAKALICRC